MFRFALRRTLLLIPISLSVMFILFTLLWFTPGDPAVIALGDEVSPQAVAAFNAEHGLDKPFIVQFGNYVSKVVFHADFGYSYAMRTSVTDELIPRVPVTFRLAFWSVFFSTVVGIPLGIICAIKQYSVLDSVVTVITLLGISIPTFWTGLLLILGFSVYLGWLPSMGFETVSEMVLPLITLSGMSMAVIARMTRSSMLEVIKSDYIRTARSKGQKEFIIIFKHALPNALIPVMTIIGLQFGALLGGSIVTEAVFSISGVGRLMIEAIKVRDYPILQAGVLFISLAFCVVNLLVDILYAIIDPRIRLK